MKIFPDNTCEHRIEMESDDQILSSCGTSPTLTLLLLPECDCSSYLIKLRLPNSLARHMACP